MIKVEILTENGNIGVKYDEKNVVVNDIALIMLELERIKKALLEKEFEYDLYKEGESDEETDILS